MGAGCRPNVNTSPLSWADPGWAIAQGGWPRRRALRAEQTWPQADDLWQRIGQVPQFDLQFASAKSLLDQLTGSSLVSYSRASTATFVDAGGELQIASINEPRFTHNATTGQCLGLLIEPAGTNLLLNSSVLSTQSVAVTATPHTLHFTGTGSVALSGASTAGPLVGVGSREQNRVSLIFTPTAGTLTLTVTGEVLNAQLEARSFKTSYIPTAGAAVTRSEDIATIPSSFFSRNESTFLFQKFTRVAGFSTTRYAQFNGGGENRLLSTATFVNNSTTGVAFSAFSVPIDLGVQSNYGYTFWRDTANTYYQITKNGIPTFLLRTVPGDGLPTSPELIFGSAESTMATNVKIFGRITYWPARFTADLMSTLTKQ